MPIERTSQTTLMPRLYEQLVYRQNVPFYNTQRELRRPLGIYNLSLNEIWQSFEEVLDELDQVTEQQAFRENPPDHRWDGNLLRRQERLISDLARHFDDCVNVLACFYPMQHKSLEEDRKRIIKLPTVKSAVAKVKPYRDHIMNVMNHLKHQQGALRGVVVFNDEKAIQGYFVEHVNQTEAIEPHPDVHKSYQGQSTAYSYNRDLRYKLWLVYAVSEVVADAVEAICQRTSHELVESGIEDRIAKIATRIARLPKWMFIDEQKMDFPNVEVQETNSYTNLRLEYLSNVLLPASSGRYNVALAWMGDGITTTFHLPYFNP